MVYAGRPAALPTVGTMQNPDKPRRIAVFLLQLGGPETLADIESFLRNLFEDVLPVPAFLRPWIAAIVARRRAPKVAPQYQHMGGGSPLLRNTRAQSDALLAELKKRGFEPKIFITMRYAPPRAEVALAEARRDWSDATWVALPLYPHYSFATTRSSMDELQNLFTSPELTRLQVVQAYPEDPGYLDVLTETIREAVARVPEPLRSQAHVLFSAHGLPLRLVKQGDPYPEHIAKTLEGVRARLPKEIPITLSYQSRVGPVKWLAPSAIESVEALGREGKKALVIVPVSFVSEHIETLVELDVDLRETARKAGIQHFERAATVDARPRFITALADLVERALEGA